MESIVNNNQQKQIKSPPATTRNQLISKSSSVNLLNCVFKLTNEANMFAKLLSPKSSKSSRNDLTRRNNSNNNKRKEEENGLPSVTQCRPNEMVSSPSTETVSVKLTHEPNPQSPVKTNNNNNVISINNQRNQHNQRYHQPGPGLSSSSSSSWSSPSPQSSFNEKRRKRVNDENTNDQLISGDNLILPGTYRETNSNQSINCVQINEHQEQQTVNDQDDNLNSNTMTSDSDNHNHLTASSLVNEAFRIECIQLRRRVRDLEQQNRLLTLLLAEQLLNSSSNSVDDQNKLEKLLAINSLTNNLPQLISEYESTLLDLNNSNSDQASTMKTSPGQGQVINESKGVTLKSASESDYCRSGGNEDEPLNNNNNHHDDDDDDESLSSRRLVSMSEGDSMLGDSLSHVNIDRWRKIQDDQVKTKTTTTSPPSSSSTATATTTTQLTSQPNLPLNQLNLNFQLNGISETIKSKPLEPLISSLKSSDCFQGKSSYLNNLVHNNSTLFTSSPSPTSNTSTHPFTTPPPPTSTSPRVLPTLASRTSVIPTNTVTTLTSTLLGSPSSSLSLSPPQSPRKLVTCSSILDSSLFQSTNITVNCNSPSTNQLEKRILFILASNNNNNKTFNSTFSSISSSSTTSSSSYSSSSSSFSTDKINCDTRLINKPGNLALRTLSGSSSSLKDNNLSLSSVKSIVSLEKDSPASSATSFDSNGELTSKDEGYSTMSSDVQSDIGNNNITPIVTINTTPSSSSSISTTTAATTTTTITNNNKSESTIKSIVDEKQSIITNGKINKSLKSLNSPPVVPPRATQPPSSASSSVSSLFHLKQHQQLKGETIEIKSEPKRMGINGSSISSVPLTFMSSVNPIVVGSSRLTTFKSPHQTDALVTSSSPSSSSSSPLTTTINNKGKNNTMESLCQQDTDSLIGDTIKLNCKTNITATGIKTSSQSTTTTTTGNNLIDDNKSSNWSDYTNGTKEMGVNESQPVNCCNSIVKNDLIRRTRKSFNEKSSSVYLHRYSFPSVTTVKSVTKTGDDIEWTPCLIYQPSRSKVDHQVDHLIGDQGSPGFEVQLITTGDKVNCVNLDDDDDDYVGSRSLVNKREVIVCEDKRKRSGKNYHHMGKSGDEDDDGKTNEGNHVQLESDAGNWKGKPGERRRKSSVSRGAESDSLMKTPRNIADDEDEYDEEEDEEEEEEEENQMNFKIDLKRKMKVHHKLVPVPVSSSSSHESQSLHRCHSDSQLYSDSMKQEKEPVTALRSSHRHQSNNRSSCRRDIIKVNHPSHSATGKRSSGYIRRRIRREDRARIDESHRWSTLSTSSSALSDGLEVPIYCERRRPRPRLPVALVADAGIQSLPKPIKTGTSRSIRYISSDENHSADDEDSAERFVSRWLHKSGGGLRWDDSEVTWKLNESLDWPEPIDLDSNSNCLGHISSSTSSSPSSTSSGPGKQQPEDNQMVNHLNADDTFEEIPLIDDDSSESEKIEIISTISDKNDSRNNYRVLVSPCDDEGVTGGGIDVSHEGGGEGYISSDQASSVPDDGLTPETHFNGDFYRLCSVGSRTSLQQPDDEISLPPLSSGALSSLSSSSSPPLTDVKEQDEEEEEDDSAAYDNNRETKIILRQLTNSNDQDNDDDDELLVITTTTHGNNQLSPSQSFDQDVKKQQQQKVSSLIKSQSTGSSGQLPLTVISTDSLGVNCPPTDLPESTEKISIAPVIMMINSLQSTLPTKCLSSLSSSPSSSLSSTSSPGKSVKFGQLNVDDQHKQTTSSTLGTGSSNESQSFDCHEKLITEQSVESIIEAEQLIYADRSNYNETIKGDDPIYEEIAQIKSPSQSTSKLTKVSTINCHPKPILVKSSSANQSTSSSPTRIPLPKQSNSLDAIKTINNKEAFKLRFNSTTSPTIDSITNHNNVNNLITKSFINQHQVKRLNSKTIDPDIGKSSSVSSMKKSGTESKSIKMMMDWKAKMERNNNQVNSYRLFNRKFNQQSIPSVEEFERRLSEDKQMADKIREFYSLFDQQPVTQLTPTTGGGVNNLGTTIKSPVPIPPSAAINSPPSIKGVPSKQRSRSSLSGDFMKGNKLSNNIEEIKSKLNYPKLLRSKGIGGMGSGSIGSIGMTSYPSAGSDSGKTMKEGHETSWVHVSGFTVGKVSETFHDKPPASSSNSSPSSVITPISTLTTTTTTSVSNCNKNLISGKLSSDSCSSEDEFNLGDIHGGRKRSSFHQRLLALHKSRRQKKRASDGYMGMGFLPKIRASIVDRLDFYHRFGDKEQEALTAFNFLNDLPTSSSSSSTSKSSSSSSSGSVSERSNEFIQDQKLLLRCYLNSFEPLSSSSADFSFSSTHSLPPPPPPSVPRLSSSSSFTLSSPYKWPQSPIKSSSSSSPRYQSTVGNNYMLNHEMTARPVGGVS